MRINAHSSMSSEYISFDQAQYLKPAANDNVSHMEACKQDAE